MSNLLKCGKYCGSHVFTIYKEGSVYMAICDLCYTPQPLEKLLAGNVPVEKMLKLIKKR